MTPNVRVSNNINFGLGYFNDFLMIYSEAVVEEAIKVFELNEGLFTLLRPPSNGAVNDSASERPPLGNPSPQITPEREPSPELVNKGTAADSGEKMYSMSSILSVVLAVGLAHFLLVVGGFTGQQGWVKYDAVFTWFDELMHGKQ